MMVARVDFTTYVELPDEVGRTVSQLRSRDGFALRLTDHGIEATRHGCTCVYPLPTVRQWWPE
jgi:hypothetical protein